MSDVRCDYCFREKPTASLMMSRAQPVVCKGCRYELDKAIGFLEHSGLTFQAEMKDLSDTPPDPPKNKRKLSPGESNT